MASSLKEFLAQEAERLKQESPRIEAERQEWVAAINALFDQMVKWLQEVDQFQVLQVERRMVGRRDSKLGDYMAPAMYISLGTRTVVADPVAFTVVAPKITVSSTGTVLVSKGRVDLESPDRAYKLYRYMDDQNETTWIIASDSRDSRSAILDRARFEDALLSLFQ